VTVAAFPEGHPESTSVYDDLDNLKRKIDAGASRAITQFFFENDIYFRYLERCHKAGITCEIVPASCQ
jgi:methylenetetrahydrofolate reductase (NADPH)